MTNPSLHGILFPLLWILLTSLESMEDKGIARACDVYEICLIFILSTAFVSSFGIGVGHLVEKSEFLYLFR